MKKIFFAIAAVAALASCSKSNVEYVPSGDQITLLPVAKNITKSMITTSEFPTSESFNVWAWYNQVEPGTPAAEWDTTTDSPYISEGEFVFRSAGNWGGATAYFWPKVGSLLFAGYYPASVAAKVDYAFDATANEMVFSNIPQGTVASTGTSEDLMYFNMTASSATNGPLPVVFKHALSWVTVNLSRPEANAENAEYPKIVVNSVTFTNVNNQGTGVVAGTDGTIDWTVNGAAAPTVVTPEGGVVLSTTPAKQAEPLFIPQTFVVDDKATADKNEAMELQVNYTIYSSESEFFTETYSKVLAGMEDTNEDELSEWEPSKHYTYNISIGLSEILIAPTVDDWTGVTVNVPVQ